MAASQGRPAPSPSMNPGASSHETLKAMTDAAQPAGAQAVADEWARMAAGFDEAATLFERATQRSEGGWRGEAAEAMRAQLGQVAAWSRQTGAHYQAAAEAIGSQAEAANTAKTTMPPPVPYDPAAMIRQAAASGNISELAALPALMYDQKQKRDAAHEEAVRVVAERDRTFGQSAAAIPVFEPPPRLSEGGGRLPSTPAPPPVAGPAVRVPTPPAPVARQPAPPAAPPMPVAGPAVRMPTPPAPPPPPSRPPVPAAAPPGPMAGPAVRPATTPAGAPPPRPAAPPPPAPRVFAAAGPVSSHPAFPAVPAPPPVAAPPPVTTPQNVAPSAFPAEFGPGGFGPTGFGAASMASPAPPGFGPAAAAGAAAAGKPGAEDGERKRPEYLIEPELEGMFGSTELTSPPVIGQE